MIGAWDDYFTQRSHFDVQIAVWNLPRLNHRVLITSYPASLHIVSKCTPLPSYVMTGSRNTHDMIALPYHYCNGNVTTTIGHGYTCRSAGKFSGGPKHLVGVPKSYYDREQVHCAPSIAGFLVGYEDVTSGWCLVGVNDFTGRVMREVV